MSDRETLETPAETLAAVETPEAPATSDTTFKTDSRHLTTDFTLLLHTATGQGLFSGEWAPGKMGLREFGRCVQILWNTFEQQDPYAEWQLLKIFETLQQLKSRLKDYEKHLHKQIRSLRDLQVKAFRNAKPLIISLSSVNSLVLLAASLITRIDYLARLLLTLKPLGIVAITPVRTQELCEDMQKIFMLGTAWEKTEITRQEIVDNTKRAQKIEKQWGKLPEDILYQTAVLPFLLLEE